jgi:hypothetical protein
VQSAEQYVQLWANPGPDLEAKLRRIVDPRGVLFRADGVVHQQDRLKTIPELAAHIRERHAAYSHKVHVPFALAANELSGGEGEAAGEVFLGVRFMMQHVGPILGHETGTDRWGVTPHQVAAHSMPPCLMWVVTPTIIDHASSATLLC